MSVNSLLSSNKTGINGACATMGLEERCIQDFSRDTSGQKALGIHTRRWKDGGRA